MCDVGRASAAMRRRQRHLRAFLRHEELSLVLTLAKALHHSVEGSSEGEVHATYGAPRRWKAPLAGKRSAPLPVVAAPHGGLRAPRCPGAGVPSLALPLLTDSLGDGVDDTALSNLLQLSLSEKEEEEEKKKAKEERKERLQETHRKVRADQPVTDAEWAAWREWVGIISSSSSTAGKSKKKKRKKKKLPQTSSSRAACARNPGHYPTSPRSGPCSVSTCCLRSTVVQGCGSFLGEDFSAILDSTVDSFLRQTAASYFGAMLGSTVDTILLLSSTSYFSAMLGLTADTWFAAVQAGSWRFDTRSRVSVRSLSWPNFTYFFKLR